MDVCVMGRDDGCLLSGGEGVRGRVVLALFLTDASLAFPFWVGSVSIFLLSHEFSFLSASISSALRFLKSASSCCILTWPSRMAAKFGVMLAGVVGLALGCFVTPALLRVETIVDSMRVDM